MAPQLSLAFRRTLHLIRALQHAPCDRETLQALICRAEGDDAYHHQTGRALQKAFEEDLRRAREQFGVTIRYNRSRGCYEIAGMEEHGWLDPPDEVLRTLLFLYHTFDEDAPEAAEVRAALDWIASLLPTGRRQWLDQQRLGYDVELRELDQPLSPQVFETIRAAVLRRHALRFLYHSPRAVSQQPVQHRVAPVEVIHRDGHWYLIARDLERRDEAGTTYPNRQKRFRLSYIVPGEVHILATRLPLTLHPPRRYRLRYRLHPDLARGDISARFENTAVTPLPDGWAEVTAETTDLFYAAQTLFRYADKCLVLEPPQLVEMLRGWLWGMMALYER